ncbi:MAG TPA: ABC transporter permease, partial [Candidatus Ozemobacteraceae bacterium]|nr:ABC transporter permease [Candidatus Ozemobacteraceae bacterium]
MLEYTLRRLVGTVPVILGILLIAFVVLYLVPGDPAATLAGPRASQEDIARIAREMGLDRSLPERFVNYLDRMVHGDLGTSVVDDRPVLTSILEKVPYTLKLAVMAMIFSILIGLAAGIVSAIHRGSLLDRATTLLAVTGISVPVFLSGLILLYLLAGKLKWFPTSAFGAEHTLWPLVLPAFTLGIRSGAFLARIVRSSLIEVLNQDYIRTARAKGLSPARILVRHALTNALIPIVTVVALDFSSFLNGSVIVETIFEVPGLGRFAMDAILKRDYPVIQGVVLFSALIFVFVNLLIDLVYAWINPRIREELM